MRLPLAFVGGKPGNPALITAYDTVLLSSFSTVNYYIITLVSSCYFFSPLIFSPSTPTYSPIYNKQTAISLSSFSLLARLRESERLVDFALPYRVTPGLCTYSVLRPTVPTWPKSEA
jgi:hypothetical protein